MIFLFRYVKNLETNNEFTIWNQFRRSSKLQPNFENILKKDTHFSTLKHTCDSVDYFMLFYIT